MVAVWIGWHNHKVLSIPFVELDSSRLAIEVYHALTRVVNRLENFVSDVLPSIEHSTNRTHSLRILRLHSDRASEFMGIVAKNWARHHNVHTTFTGAHSPQVRRALLSSGLPLEFWGLAARHSGEMLRSHNLRKAGDKKAEQPLPFGSLVAIRRLGKAVSFKPFEKRGCLGRILFHETGSRRCLVLERDLESLKLTGRHAWFNPDMGLFRLTPSTLMTDEPFEKVVEEEGFAESACSNSPDVASEYEMARSDTAAGCASDISPADDEEGYCCGCGRLVWQHCSHVVGYCTHYCCFECRTSYAFDGGRVWACRHHPELRVAGAQQKEKVDSDVSCGL
eukprot:3421826-Amphidinium_carterae.2